MGAPWRPRGPDDLDDDQRARIRWQVLRTVRPLRRTFADRVSDRFYDLLEVLAVPAPHIVRALLVGGVIVSIVGTATVASADAVPDEPLYAVKVAGEQVRLALARTPEDRAAVELSMAEHRLSEAERLAYSGREGDALVATSAYGTHLANAAAELAAIERLNSSARPVVDRLKQRLAQQQQRAADVAARFVDDPVTAVGAQLFRTVASFAPALPSGSTVSEGIAAHAANIAGQLAVVAERLAEEARAAEATVDAEEQEEGAEPPQVPPAPVAEPAVVPAARATPQPTQAPRATPRRTPALSTATPAAVGAVRGPEATRAAATAKPTAKPKATVDPKKAADTQAAKAALEKAKHEAQKARTAAEKAKEAAKKTATPRPSPRR